MGQRYAAQEERRAAQDAFTMFVAYTRARGALRDMSELGQQTDPLEPWAALRLLADVADFFLADYGSGRTLELGRSPRTPLARSTEGRRVAPCAATARRLVSDMAFSLGMPSTTTSDMNGFKFAKDLHRPT
jgi:hypothetical protein